MEIIPHRKVVIDSELVERLIVCPGYEVDFIDDSLHKTEDEIRIVLWNWWISN